MLTIDDHPLLDLGAFVTTFPHPIGEPGWDDLSLPVLLETVEPIADDRTRTTVRDLLRVGGFKPSGRNKPASEYVQKAVPSGRLGAINPVVDACNAASYGFGLPISVVDLDRTRGDLRVGIAPADSQYVFNASGQEIRLDGLLCLFDAEGPCANSVKDSQRTKTQPGTTRTLSLIWGTTALGDRTRETMAWYRRVLDEAGAETTLP